MPDWQLTSKGLKHYPHFDAHISIKDAMSLANDPAAVAAHTFYPFILYKNRWTRFAERGEVGDVKERPIRYASRADAYIFSRYRDLLAQAYETALVDKGLSDSVLAYRRLKDIDGKGKCNIHFARDAFKKVAELENCCVVALDISSFFESLDHGYLKSTWCKLLHVEKLPADHFRVFRAITKYAVLEKEAAYERLGYFGIKSSSKSGKSTKGYLLPYKQMPKQLCTGRQFREKIAGGDGTKSLIQVHLKDYGIPQGAPISDVLANIYLLEFDSIVRKRMNELGGVYFRYSDDILLISPGGEQLGKALAKEMRELIVTVGNRLAIKEKKSSVFVFTKHGTHQECVLVEGAQGKNGLEYLGFRFDGKRIYIRDSTLSNLYRKVARSARYFATSLVRRYPGKGYKFLLEHLDYERLIQNFGRVQEFGEFADDYRSWTFWTYARRAAQIFGAEGRSIVQQLRSLRKNVKARVCQELARAVERGN
jgi:hypothetical protein